ncbi:MAG: energy transducer TonB [Polyangiaceae bacterium]
MNRNRSRSIRVWVIGGSLALHAAMGAAAAVIPKEQRAETAAIELSDLSKLKSKDKPKPPPPPLPPPPPKQDKPKPPPPPPKSASQAKVVADAPKADLPPVPMGEDGVADMGGLAMGGPGAGSGPVAAAAVAGPARPKETKKVVQQLAPAAADECTEPPIRPKPKVAQTPKYTLQARQAEIEGVVRVQVTVDETGNVIAAKVLSGLGYGLDEEALKAAKAIVFTPASRCGKAIVGTVTLPFRFELS